MRLQRTYTLRSGLAEGLKKRSAIDFRKTLGGGLRKTLGGGLRKTLGVDRSPLAEEEEFLRDLDFSGRTIFDVGAFVGIHTLFFAHRAGSTGHVVAFEPDPENYHRTLTNVRINGFENVAVLNVGLGRHSEALLFAYPDDRGQGSAEPAIREKLLHRGDARTVTVPVRPLDEEIAERELPDPDFVKIDVEGLELAVLEGMAQTVARCRPTLFIEIHGADEAEKERNVGRVARWLSERGYAMTHVESNRPVTPSSSQLAREGHLYCTSR